MADAQNVTLLQYTAADVAEMMNSIIGDALEHPGGHNAQALKQKGIDPHEPGLRQKAMKALGFDESNLGGEGSKDHRMYVYADGSQVAILSGKQVELEKQISDKAEHPNTYIHLQRSHGIGSVSRDAITTPEFYDRSVKGYRLRPAPPEFLELLFHPKDKPLGTDGIMIPYSGGGLGHNIGAAAEDVYINKQGKEHLRTAITVLAKNDQRRGGSALEQVAAAARAAVGDYTGGTVLAKPVPTDTQGRNV